MLVTDTTDRTPKPVHDHVQRVADTASQTVGNVATADAILHGLPCEPRYEKEQADANAAFENAWKAAAAASDAIDRMMAQRDSRKAQIVQDTMTAMRAGSPIPSTSDGSVVDKAIDAAIDEAKAAFEDSMVKLAAASHTAKGAAIEARRSRGRLQIAILEPQVARFNDTILRDYQSAIDAAQ